jgi:nucleotidyltransferase/DNA polymerase involved in DNA repair
MLDNSLNRKIIHIDMDAFMLLWSKWTTHHCEEAVAVGGSENRVVAAASYEARKFGVRSATGGVMAKKFLSLFLSQGLIGIKRVSSKIQRFYEYGLGGTTLA